LKRLQGAEPAELGLRLGDYRIRFYDLAVKHRKSAYRQAPRRPRSPDRPRTLQKVTRTM
jgi:hypothetical protein